MPLVGRLLDFLLDFPWVFMPPPRLGDAYNIFSGNTPFVWDAHRIFACPLDARGMSARFVFLYAHWKFMGCLLDFHGMFVGRMPTRWIFVCTLDAHGMAAGFSFYTHWIFVGCPLEVHGFSLDVHRKPVRFS